MTTMQKHSALTRQRVQKFIRDAWTWRGVYPETKPVKIAARKASGRVPYAEGIRGTFNPIKVGHHFGPTWSTHWVRVEATIPAAWKGREVRLRWDSSCEACVWQNGVPRQGLTGSGRPDWEAAGNEPIRAEYVLTRRAKGNERVTLYIEVACNQLFGLDDGPKGLGELKKAEIAVFDREAWDLHFDFLTVAEMMEQLPPNQPRGAQAMYAANAFINAFDPDNRATRPAARRVLKEFLKARNGDAQHRISAIGHAHIDTAWLWPLAETERKCYRSFSSVLRIAEEYPEFKFACSQAHQYEWIKNGQPALYREIKAAARKGQFIPVGGTWIEPDCNLPSGEALVRQFLYGQRFFKKEFGHYCKGFWNPDVFGYNGQLPQIIRGAGMEWFLTQKLSWNQINKPDAHTFWWEGIDGTRVLTHFPPTDTYNGVATVKELLFHMQNYKDLERSNESICLFGFGDGGGGPTREMLERLRRAKDVDGLPKVDIRAPDDFFERLTADAKPLVEKVGELYLEVHRGTYTTQAAVKKNNRRAEELLHDVELLAALNGKAYPQKGLDQCWKILLLNQFHDIIPGSSITEVYEDAAKDYAELFQQATTLRDKALKPFIGKAGTRFIAVNTLDRPRREVVELGDGQSAILEAPSMGYAVQTPVTTHAFGVKVQESKAGFVLENERIRARLDRKGQLRSLQDKATGCETIKGAANHFVMYEDKPIQFDAWDIDVYHAEKPMEEPAAETARIESTTNLCASIRFTYRIGRDSRMTQVVSLNALQPYLTFSTDVDWQETQRYLRVEFPSTIRANQATYETQFGHVQRPTHYNSSHDLARFEVCAHRWADLSEPGCGLALLNDCKYGHSVYRDTLRLSLLRAPLYPDPKADRGAHTFRYALMPHAGDWRAADVPDIAAAFNQPLLVRPTAQAEKVESWFQIDAPSVRIDTVKKAEDEKAVIVRCYEMYGGHANAHLTTPQPIRKAWQTNLLEEPHQALRARGDTLSLTFRPFEIKTLLLQW